jgi:hypothetical protein
MSDLYKNPETDPQSEGYVSPNTDMQDWGGSHMEPAGPAGRTNNVNANEKGILEVGLFRAMALHQVAELGSEHDSHAVGIYASTDSKFAD